MRDCTAGAVFYASVKLVTSSAFIKMIERTEAEQAVEVAVVAYFVAGEIAAFAVSEKVVAVFHGLLPVEFVDFDDD